MLFIVCVVCIPGITHYVKITRIPHKRMLERGHTAEDINSIFLQVDEKIKIKATTKFIKYIDMTKIKEIENTLFFNYKYHSRDISRKKIRDLYELTCETTDENGDSLKSLPTTSGEKLHISRLTLPYSRQKYS